MFDLTTAFAAFLQKHATRWLWTYNHRRPRMAPGGLPVVLVQSDFLEGGEVFYPDIQYVDDQYQQIALVDNGAAVNQAGSGEFKVGVCRPLPNVAGMDVGLDQALTPVGSLVNYLWKFDSKLSKLSEDNRRRALYSLEKSAVVSLVERPKYGVLTKTVDLLGNKPEKGLDFYIPRSGDMRKDRVSYVVEMGGYRVKVIYSIIPINDGVVSEETVRQLCGRKGEYYRIAAEVAVDTETSAEDLLGTR